MNFNILHGKATTKLKTKNFVIQYIILIQLPYLFCVTVKYHSIFVKTT